TFESDENHCLKEPKRNDGYDCNHADSCGTIPMILKECSPTGCRWQTMLWKARADSLFNEIVTKFAQFGVYAHEPPSGIFIVHLKYQATQSVVDLRLTPWPAF